MGDLGILLYAGFERRRALFYNFLTALTTFIGAAEFLVLNVYVKDLTVFLVSFAAGNFTYIAGSDLIPELSNEEELGRTIFQLAAIALGLILMFIIGRYVGEAA